MEKRPLGIILSRREWNRMIQMRAINDDESIIFEYAKRGEQLNIEVIFFNIDEVTTQHLTGNAFIIEDKRIIEIGKVKIPEIVYNPTNYHRRKNIKTLIDLAQHPDVHVINEQYDLKSKSLFDLLKSHPELKNHIEVDENRIESEILFYALGQKNEYHQWQISGLYAKDSSGTIYSCEEALPLCINNQLNGDEMEEEILQVSQEILGFIHYYYPGLYELGLRFKIKNNGEVQLDKTDSILPFLKDLSEFNKEQYRKAIYWPIELAKAINVNNVPSEKTSINKITDNEVKFTGETNLSKQNIWVKFKAFQGNEMTIKMPDRVGKQFQIHPSSIKFGVKEEPCDFILYDDPIPLRNNSYHFPVDIFASQTLVKKMHIPIDIVFQLTFSNGKVIIGPTIGLLLGEKNQKYNLNYMEKFSDRFGEYARFGGVAIAFSTRSVDWEEKIVYGMIYDHENKRWRYDSAPIPSTLYRRNFHQNQERIEQLVELTDNNLFNSFHFKKSDLYLLKDEPEITNHLPATFLLKNIRDLIDFIIDKKKIILKPVGLSRGRGIYILELNNNGLILYDYRNNTKVQHMIDDMDGLQKVLNELGILDQEYLYQTYIPLLKVNNRAFDVRVVMQKYNKMKWLCSGIECRVAQENEDLTNIARGGEAMTLEDVIKKTTGGLSYSPVHKSILRLCQRFCYLMNKMDEHFAEFGIDIALDEEGYPWILEANIYPSFKGFKILDYETYLKIRYQPLFYAVQIQGFKIHDDNVTGGIYHTQERSFY